MKKVRENNVITDVVGTMYLGYFTKKNFGKRECLAFPHSDLDHSGFT